MDPDLRRSIDELRGDIRVVRDQATSAHEEARGAHQQATKTNGRVNDLEDSNDELRRAMWGPKQLGVHDKDAGVVGYLRQIRILLGLLLAVITIVIGPVAAAVITSYVQELL